MHNLEELINAKDKLYTQIKHAREMLRIAHSKQLFDEVIVLRETSRQLQLSAIRIEQVLTQYIN